MVAVEEKQSSLTRCVVVMALGALGAWGRGGGGGSGKGEAFGVPQRGTAYQPGVKPRVWRTTFRFTEEKHPRYYGEARAIAYLKNPRMAVITRSTWSSVSSGYIGKGWMRRLTASVTG